MRPITDPDAIQAEMDPREYVRGDLSTIALLCTGPSVKETWEDGMYARYCLVVAVNNVATKHSPPAELRHDIQAHFDRAPGRIRLSSAPLRWKRELFASFPGSPYKQHRCNYSFPNVLWTLREFFPETPIDVYGNDQSFAAGLGSVAGSNTCKRWYFETQVTSRVPNWRAVHPPQGG